MLRRSVHKAPAKPQPYAAGGQPLLFDLLIESHRTFDPDAPDAQVPSGL